MSRPEITIGLSVSLSGKFHPQGQQALQGIRLWQAYINAQGGIAVQNGEKRSVRLIWYDDRSQISFAGGTYASFCARIRLTFSWGRIPAA